MRLGALLVMGLLLCACDGGSTDDAGARDAGARPSDADLPDRDAGRDLDAGDAGQTDAGAPATDGGGLCQSFGDVLPPAPGCGATCACGPADCMLGAGPNVCRCDGCGCEHACAADDCQLICAAEHCALEVGAFAGPVVSCTDDATCVLGLRGSVSANAAGTGAGEMHVDCRDSASCRVLCGGGKDCFVDCRDSTSCAVLCETGSRCHVRCDGATDCRFEDCYGREERCGVDSLVCET